MEHEAIALSKQSAFDREGKPDLTSRALYYYICASMKQENNSQARSLCWKLLFKCHNPSATYCTILWLNACLTNSKIQIVHLNSSSKSLKEYNNNR